MDVPAAPPLGRVANVELMHTGTWPAATGPATFTVEDLVSAVAALDCPSVRRPILKLGHSADPAPGQPAIGFIANMATADDGKALVGDYVGMPGWLVDTDDDGNSVLTSAYPDRSIEGTWNFQCQIGHTHPFVVTAVALLGEERPAVGTIESLQDLAELYGVAATAADESADAVTVTISTTQGEVMPNPRPIQVAASVTTEDVRRAFYNSPLGAGWSKWIEEMQLDPLQLIVVDDDAGTRLRVPVTVGDGDGQEAVEFADPVEVVIRYDDAGSQTAAAAAAGPGRRILFASRTESRPTPTPAQAAAQIAAASKKTSPAASAGAASTPMRGAGMDLAKIREGLGLDPDSSEDDVKAALAQAGLATAATEPSTTPAAAPAATPEGGESTPAEPVAAAATPAPRGSGTLTIDASAWDAQQERIKRLEAKEAKRDREERDQVIAEAIQDGKFLPKRREHWVKAWDGDPKGTRELLAGLQKNVVPVEAMGLTVDGDEADLDAEFAHLFPPAHDTKGA